MEKNALNSIKELLVSIRECIVKNLVNLSLS